MDWRVELLDLLSPQFARATSLAGFSFFFLELEGDSTKRLNDVPITAEHKKICEVILMLRHKFEIQM